MRVPNIVSIVKGMMIKKKQEYAEFEYKLLEVQRKITAGEETLENTQNMPNKREMQLIQELEEYKKIIPDLQA